MKRLSIILLTILMAANIHAQVSFYQGDKKLSDGDTITVTDVDTNIYTGGLVMDSKLKLKNESNSAAKIACFQDVKSYVGEGQFQFCVGSCTTGVNNLTLSTYGEIAPGNFISGFGVEYNPEAEKYGIAMATYTANLAGSTQKSKVTVVFDYQSPTGINTIQTSKVKVYSTTESLILRCPSASAEKISIYDISGKIIANYNLYGSQKEYFLSKIDKKGIYLYSVAMKDGTIISGKFVDSTK